jgi:lysophospholipase L1-like esterase
MRSMIFIRSMISAMANKPEAWEWAIARFEAEDRIHPPKTRGIVFTGSSSITFWDTLEKDMAPLPVINRGFGGSKIKDVVHYVGRIVIPYQPRIVLLFAGTNDISGSKPATAQEVYEGYLAFVQAVHAALPQVPVYYISITPTPLRWELWPIADEANQMIQTYTESDPCLHFIDMTEQFLTGEGIPERSLYRFDRLHPNQKGYARWTAVIKPILQAELR